MGNIVLLDELTINKIAAGEVIERPASVIKEMVENSIDAGAKNITIEIKNGGISFIRITDNGKGIAKDDIELAFERHATSKIRSADDLDTVKSMGFRGEALASIGAISTVELVSRTEADSIGNRIIVEGGDVISLDEIGCSKGTTITVRNLFFNTPVRYKFLKKDYTESGYIEDVVTRIALIHPEVAIKFINSGKTVIQTTGNGELTDVIYSIYGKEIAKNIMDVEYDYEYIKIKGVIGKPNIARSNRSNQIFFVNKRYIKDKTLSSAVEQAFKGMLPVGKFAFLILNVEMNPSKVDVNVHPAKLEVRFAEENIVFKAVYHAIKDTLLKSGFMTGREKTLEIKEASKDAFKIQNIEEKTKETYSISSDSASSNADTATNLSTSTDSLNIAPTGIDYLEKLKALQESLKKEVEQNPSIKLTSEYKNMQEKYNKIISPEENQEDEKEQEVEQKQEQKIAQAQAQEIEQVQENADITNSEDNETIEKSKETIEQNTDDIKVGNIEATENIEKVEEKVEDNIEDINNGNVENVDGENIEEIEDANNENIENADEENIEEQSAKETVVNEQDIENNEENNIQKEEANIEDVKETVVSFEEMYRQLFGKEPYGGRKQEETTEENYYKIDTKMEDSNVSMFESDPDYYKKKAYKFLGIAFNTYIILEIDDEIYIMDQHAAHERIMYEKVKKNFFENGEKSSQLLLLPDIVTLTHKEMNIAKDNFDLFKQAGFVLEEFGENTIKISGVPDVCIDLDTKELFKETLDEINTVARTAKQEKEEKFLATIACKAAVKANMKLTKEEVDSLMEKLLELPNPFTCPHGRPTVIKMSKYEIERKFARK